jgi:HNH endonuclease
MSHSPQEAPGPAGRLKRVPIVPLPLLPASAAQRRKVAAQRCAVCGRRPVDPAHLVPQRLGGCAEADCVIALCRTHHRLYDSGALALAPYLGRGFRRERGHALRHVRAAALRRALAGGGWAAPIPIANRG